MSAVVHIKDWMLSSSDNTYSHSAKVQTTPTINNVRSRSAKVHVYELSLFAEIFKDDSD